MKSLKESNNIQSKEFGDWAVVFWKKGSKTLSIAQNQGDLGTTDFWMVGTTTRQFDYESGWLPNKEWSTAIKGHFSKDKAIQMAKEQAMKGLKESRINIPNKFPLSLEDLKEAYPGFEEVSDLEMCAVEAGEAIAFATVERTPKGYILMGPPGCDYVYEGSSIGELGEDMEDLIHNLDVDETWPSITNNNLSDFDESTKENNMKIRESRKPFTSDIPNNLLEIQNNMEDIFEVNRLSIAASESANGLARDILTWTGTKVGELLFTPASYYMVGPREDIYWEGSTLEEFEADVADLSYTL